MGISDNSGSNSSNLGLSRRKKSSMDSSTIGTSPSTGASVYSWGSNNSNDTAQRRNINGHKDSWGKSFKSHRSSDEDSLGSRRSRDDNTLSYSETSMSKSAAGTSRMYNIYTEEFNRMIESESVKNVLKLLFSSLAVVFQEIEVSSSKKQPYFKFTRIPSIPAPAAGMLWSELLGGVSARKIADQQYEMTISSISLADQTISQVCLEEFLKFVNDPVDLLVKISRNNSNSKGLLSKLWNKKKEEEGVDILKIAKKQNTKDPFLFFVRDALVATGFLEVAGRSIDLDEEVDSDEEEEERDSDDFAEIDGIDFSGWDERKKKKKQKNALQYFQIYQDMQFQYGIHLSGIIGNTSTSILNVPPETDVWHQKETETAKRWNDAMSNACWKQLIKAGILGSKSDHVLSTGDGDEDRKKKTQIWMNRGRIPNDATGYAIQMYPSHLMRAGRVVEAARVLMNPKFVHARLVSLQAFEAADRHKCNLDEMKLRSRLASEGELDVGGDGDALIMESRDIFMASVNVFLKCIQEHYPMQSDENNENGELEKKIVQGESVPGEVGRALHLIGGFLTETTTLGANTNKGQSESSLAAMETYKLALAYKIVALGKDHSSVARTHRHMGHEYMNRFEYEEAINAYSESVRINRVQDDVDYKHLVLALNSIGMIYGMTGQPKLSVDSYCESLAIQKTRFGEMDLQVAETLNSIGIVYGMMGHYDHAVQSYAESLFIKTQKLGKDHEDVADIHFNRGLVYNKDGDYESAFHDFQQALRIRKKWLGDEHEEVARVLHHIGVVLGEMGEPVDAQRCYEECLRIRRMILGDEHEDVARTLHNLGLVYFDAANYEKALDCLEDAKELGRKKIGRKSEKVADTLHTMGLVYQKLANFKESINNYEEAVKIRRMRLGNDHLEVASTLHNMGDVYYMMGDLDLAMSTYNEAYQIRRTKLGTEEHVDIASTRNNMGVVFMKQGQHKEAMECFCAALSIRQNQLGPDHEKCSDTLHNMGLVHKNLSEYEKAIERYEQALRVRRIQLGENDMKVADTLYNMAIVYANTAQYAKAIERYKEALRTYRETGMTDDHPSVVNTLQWIRWGQKKL
eukprot:CAMPEP_0194193186 /NCGR_PEP_ID=MMETSP0154-20130528/73701_1 /TAXON_ID=1049557 /ORGANISM="Thalassiothrix antarctica, Strain L6-D1" /LENGTH=1084 /DNA_ID=CAMNT_0038917233 /DNA_START=47 /DNA_END=3298 /DNA_ORIENTATION=+